jgi:hypothetical protein
MLTINGQQFAKNDSEFLDSLFTSGSTCVGYYKKTAKGVILMDMHKEVMGYCQDNAQFTGVVSASRDKGSKKIRYMFAADSKLKELLGLDTLSCKEGASVIAKALATI